MRNDNKTKEMSDMEEKCSDCEAFKNYERKEGMFALGFFCPINQKFVLRDDYACKNILSDN